MPSDAIHLVVIDNDEIILELVKRKLRHTRHRLKCFSDEFDALNYLRRITPDVLIVDQRMPRLDGIELLRELGDAVPNRTYLCSAAPLPEKLANAAEQCRAISIGKDVLSDRSKLANLLSSTVTTEINKSTNRPY